MRKFYLTVQLQKLSSALVSSDNCCVFWSSNPRNILKFVLLRSTSKYLQYAYLDTHVYFQKHRRDDVLYYEYPELAAAPATSHSWLRYKEWRPDLAEGLLCKKWLSLSLSKNGSFITARKFWKVALQMTRSRAQKNGWLLTLESQKLETSMVLKQNDLKGGLVSH